MPITPNQARNTAQIIIAKRAEEDGELTFAREVLAGAWDETNRADIKAEMNRILAGRRCFPARHDWVTDPKSHGLIDVCTICGEERA